MRKHKHILGLWCSCDSKPYDRLFVAGIIYNMSYGFEIVVLALSALQTKLSYASTPVLRKSR